MIVEDEQHDKLEYSVRTSNETQKSSVLVTRTVVAHRDETSEE
jgi:hypothetical protein